MPTYNSASRTETNPRLRRDVSRTGLLFTGFGSIVGSGWLFGALFAAQAAGPSALLAWVLGGAIMVVLALIHAELGAMFPVSSGSSRFPLYAFGGLAGFSGGWFVFLGAVTTAPIEVETVVQYSSSYLHGLTTQSSGVTVLTTQGFVVAAVLMLAFSYINILGVKVMSESNKVAVYWKLIVPLFAVTVLSVSSPHFSNFAGHGGFTPYGMKGILIALSSGGVIFSYTGFEQAIQIGGESRKPGRDIPFAVIGSMVLAVVLYCLLQLSFLLAVNPHALAQGWSGVMFTGHGETFGPFVGLALAAGLGWLAWLLYTDAIISPGATGMLYLTTGSRIIFAMAEDRHAPQCLARLSPKGVPIRAVLCSFLCGLLIFLPFPGWQTLVGFISSATILAYATATASLGALRRQAPSLPRPYRLPLASIVTPVAFVFASELILFSGWEVVWKLLAAVAIGMVVLGTSRTRYATAQRPTLEHRSASWLWLYLAGMGVTSYLGSFDAGDRALGVVHALNYLHFGWDIVVTAAFSLAIYYLAIHLRLPDAQASAYIDRLSETVADSPATSTS